MEKISMLVSLIMVFALEGTLGSEDPIESVVIPLNKPYQFSQQAYTYNYYTTTVQNPSSELVLLITVTADIQTRVTIFVSTSNSPNYQNNSWPNHTAYIQQCQYSSIDTCALHMPNVEDLPNGERALVVHYTVYVSSDCTYLLDASLETIYPIKVNQSYTVNLANIQSAMAQLPGVNFLTESGGKVDQIVITCSYTSYRNLGRFQLLAKEGDFPNPSEYSTIVSKSLNGFTQILELNPLKSVNSSYFILIEGQNNTKINFTVKAIESLANPQLIINDTISYLSKSSINYTYHSTFPMKPLPSTLLPLHVSLYAYRGYGQFVVDYCNGLYNFTFQNAGGEEGEILVDREMRYDCYQEVSGLGELLIENLVVGIVEVYYQFGYAIGLYEDTYDIYLLPSQREIGALSGRNDSVKYNIDTFMIGVNYSLTAQVLKGSINVIVQQCIVILNICSVLERRVLVDPTASITKIGYTCPALSNCYVIINQSQQSNYSKYSLINEYANKQRTQLFAASPVTDIILMNEYKYYFVNVTALRLNPSNKFSNATTINVRKTQINGDCIMLTSTTVQQPTFEDLWEDNSDVKYNFDGSAVYVANSTYPNYIYIGIMGDSQSIYHIQFVLNTRANIPAAYLDMVQDGRNEYTLTTANPYILLKYVSHIVPYSITFNPTPSCIKYSSKLPVSGGCISGSQLPNVFHDDVAYFNISESLSVQGGVYKFSAYVNSGQYYLTEDKPILIYCERACYQLIKVVINQGTASILHQGYGGIALVGQNSSSQVSNGQITLTCGAASCLFALNASMSYGGNMEVSFQSSGASEVEWRTKPMTLPTQRSNKYFYMRISRFADFSSMIFYTSAADLSIYYNIIALDDTYTNIINYQYPTPDKYQDVSYGDPLQEIHIVDIDADIIQRMKCKEMNVICVVTFTVALNASVEYSLDYVTGGLGYYSSNTYQYDVKPTWPIFSLKQEYSISYFSHQIDFLQEATNYPYTIYIKPISNCRPEIQTQSTNYLKNFYTSAKEPPLLLGQQRINYRVLSNQICLFHTALTTSPYQLLFPNIMYNLQVVPTSNSVTFTYQHRFYSASSFVVRLSQPVAAIIVNRLIFTNFFERPKILLPSIEFFQYMEYNVNKSSLTVQSVKSGQHLIAIQLTNDQINKPREITIMIEQKNQEITLLHNQQHVYIYDANDKSKPNSHIIEYEYHSTNQYNVFVSVNRMKVRVSIKEAVYYGQSYQFANVIISNVSQPWIFVNPSSTNLSNQQLVNYLIRCQFINQSQIDSSLNATLKIHIEQDGIQGLAKIYPGVSIYDSFIYNNGMNCYRFQTPAVLKQEVKAFSIDINFFNSREKYHLEDMVRGMGSMVGIYNKLDIQQFQINQNTVRMVINYFSGKTYKICYEVKSIKLVGVEYSVIINVPSMSMIYPKLYSSSATIYEGSYNMFEYINFNTHGRNQLDNQSVVMTVTNCLGASTILATPSYSDMMTGKVSHVSSQWIYSGVTSALVNIPHGYYYFAVKNVYNKQLFRVNIQPASIINGQPILLHSMYYIDWKIEPKVSRIKVNGRQYLNIQIPGVMKQKYPPLNINHSRTVYSLYLINQKNIINNQNYSIGIYTRCPSLLPSHYKDSFKPIEVKKIENNQKSQLDIVQFNIDIRDVSQSSNITIKAQLYITDDRGQQSIIEFYYEEDELRIEIENQNSSIFGRLKLLVMIAILLAFFGCVGYAWRNKKKKKKTISFQVTQSIEREMSTRSPSKNEQKNINRSSLKQQKTKVGYSQFVDEISA